MNLINIRWGFYEGIGCGIVDGDLEVEGVYESDSDLIFVSLSNCSDFYKVTVTTHSVFDMNKYMCQNTSDEVFDRLSKKIDDVAIETHEMNIGSHEDEDEVLDKLKSEYKDCIKEIYEISCGFVYGEDNEDTAGRNLKN